MRDIALSFAVKMTKNYVSLTIGILNQKAVLSLKKVDVPVRMVRRNVEPCQKSIMQAIALVSAARQTNILAMT